MALSALGRHEEAFFALCVSVAIDRNPQSVRHELTRVSYQKKFKFIHLNIFTEKPTKQRLRIKWVKFCIHQNEKEFWKVARITFFLITKSEELIFEFCKNKDDCSKNQFSAYQHEIAEPRRTNTWIYTFFGNSLNLHNLEHTFAYEVLCWIAAKPLGYKVSWKLMNK